MIVSKQAARVFWRTLPRQLFKPLYTLYENHIVQKLKQRNYLPKHLGVILDGNRHFARAKNKSLKFGWEMGEKRVEDLLKWSAEVGIKYVTVWVFSTDNFKRAPHEVQDLMSVFMQTAAQMLTSGILQKNSIRIKILGDLTGFSDELIEKFRLLEEKTKDGATLQLNVAIGYGGRDEIVQAVKKLVTHEYKTEQDIEKLVDKITHENISSHLYTSGIPDPDFIIRTSGEIRLSGFLLWQAALSEYYFTDVYWPEFRRIDFLRAIRNYQERNRRFGA